MIPTLGLILVAGWLTSSVLLWTVATFGLVMLLAAGGYVLRRRRAAAIAVIKHPFAKYIVFSILAHVALAVWLLTSRILEVPELKPAQTVIVVEMEETPPPPEIDMTKPWENPPLAPAAGPVPDLPEQSPTMPVPERPELPPVGDRQAEEAFDAAHLRGDDAVADPGGDGADVEPAFDQAVSPVAPNSRKLSELESESEQVPVDVPIFSQQVSTLNEPLQIPEAADSQSSPFDQPVGSQEEQGMDLVSVPNVQPPPRATAEASLGTPTANLSTPRTTPLRAVSAARQHRLDAATPVAVRLRSDGKPLPVIYRDRWAEDRMTVVRARGGSEDTEAAVRAALAWLERTQAPDGRWDASQFGSGRPVFEGGHDRGQTGLNADTAITGLSVLAFLGAGHTHIEGEYAETIRKGIDYLVRAQHARTDGSLVGEATGYAAMYCHGIATLCLSEAYSLTGDESLHQSVHDAIQFTLAAQHAGGGWRYRPQEPGDTSQFGWQLMALTSAHYAGFAKPIADYPTRPWRAASRFLDSVSWGSNGGLASYRPNTRPTRTMTAEAMLCRLLLNTPTDHPRIIEAANELMSELPGQGRLNYYYWYYGTLGLYHLQNHHWQRWNRALTQQLLRLQHEDGSWPTENSVWGNAGGTVYTTALGALTFEAYYRYRPFAETHRVDRTARRP